MPRHIVTFAHTSVAIDYPLGKPAELIDFLYRDVPSDPSVPVGNVLQIRRNTQTPGDWSIVHDDVTVASADSVDALAAPLMDETLRWIVDPHGSGLAIHAAVVSQHGSGILIPGPSGSGKSSLATWLTSRGFNYLGDELAIVQPDGTMQAFTRPIKLKSNGLAALQTLIDLRRIEAQLLVTGTTIMIPHKLLNPDSVQDSPTLDLILFPRYRHRKQLALSAVSPAQAGLALMECLVNARNLAGHGFGAAAALVREVPALRLEYGGYGQLEPLLERLSGAGPAGPN